MGSALDRLKEGEPLEMKLDSVAKQTKYTHAECIAAAAQYLNKRYDVVLPEFFTHNAELPDVIAFKSRYSCLVECKISRGDFLADKKKNFRAFPDRGMGDYRYYCVPKGMVGIGELPEGWGLLYVHPSGMVRQVKDSSRHAKDLAAEHHLLFYYARRAFYAGVHSAVLEYRGIDG